MDTHCGVRVEHLGAILFKGIDEFSQPNASDVIKSSRLKFRWTIYDSIAGVGETGVWLRADFQSGSRVIKKVF